MINRWRKVNGKVFTTKLRKDSDAFAKALIPVLREAADQTVKVVQNSFGNPLPFYTGNLQDSTGVGIYKDSVLVAYAKPVPVAVESQKYRGRRVEGEVELQQAFSEGTSNFPTGIWCILITAVPYATHLQKEDRDFFSEIGRIFQRNVESAIKRGLPGEFSSKLYIAR